MMAPCDVCVLTRLDDSPKDVKFCKLCDSWLCTPCRGRYDLRVVAAIKKAGREVVKRLGIEGGV